MTLFNVEDWLDRAHSSQQSYTEVGTEFFNLVVLYLEGGLEMADHLGMILEEEKTQYG